MKKLILSGSAVKGLTFQFFFCAFFFYAPTIWFDVIGDCTVSCCKHAGKVYNRPLCEFLFLFHHHDHWLTIITKCRPKYRRTKIDSWQQSSNRRGNMANVRSVIGKSVDNLIIR